MLNEQRIILMTRMASFEKNEGRKNMKIGNYFRSDYIAVQVLKAILTATIAFVLLFAVYIFYNFEDFMKELYSLDSVLQLAGDVLVYYAIMVIAYSVVTYIVCTYRYAKVKNNLRSYYSSLKKLNAMYGRASSQDDMTGGNR